MLLVWVAALSLLPWGTGVEGVTTHDLAWPLRDEPLPNGAFEFAYIAEGDRPDSPEWARGATFYQIFPDRFARSGREVETPPWAVRRDWDELPTGRGRDTPYELFGGDLFDLIDDPGRVLAAIDQQEHRTT